MRAQKFNVTDTLAYTRTNGERREGLCLEVIDLDTAERHMTGSYKSWPKDKCCRFVYRLDIEGVGWRTVCEHRLETRRAAGGS
jgi:hypothetical protein